MMAGDELYDDDVTSGIAPSTICECVECCDGEHAGSCRECAGWGSNEHEDPCWHCGGSGVCPVCNGKAGNA